MRRPPSNKALLSTEWRTAHSPDCSQEPQQLRPKSQQPHLRKVSQASGSQGLAKEGPNFKARPAQKANPAPQASGLFAFVQLIRDSPGKGRWALGRTGWP